jgi:hypothetical protein
MRTRIRVAITASALAAGAALFIATPGAIATQGDPVLAGAQNTETFETLISNTSKVSLSDCLAVNHPAHDSGLVACGSTGLWGLGGGPTGTGVLGQAMHTGVLGIGSGFGVVGHGGVGVLGNSDDGPGVWGSTVTGEGVLGWDTGATGIGVHGLADGVGSAVFGEATASGLGVYGKSASATGVKGLGGPTGVYGSGTKTGVEGSAGNTGTGVYGHNSGSTGIGVWGKTGGTGSAVYGQATTNGLGVFGVSTSGTGVKGSGATRGVHGTTSTGSGLYGENTGSVGIGVEGKTGGTGSAVYGQATTNGVGVYGVSANGTGVWATSPNGTALQVNGKAKFSRSGIATVAAGATSLNVSVTGMTASSMVIATAQQNGNVSVKAAVPSAGSFKLWLTGNAPVGGLKVAYFVLS